MRRGIAVTLTVFLPDNDWTLSDDELRESADGVARDIVHAAMRGINDDTFDAASYDAFIGRRVNAFVHTASDIVRPDDDDTAESVIVNTFDA